MALVMNTNTASLAAQRHLNASQSQLGDNIARLASGMRIVKASDDAAGLGISEGLKADIRSMAQAERNANDGISMIQVAEGAMNEQSGILVRMRELAMQAANGTLGSVERGYIETERAQLELELDRIASVTEFSGTNMLAAGATIDMQVGIQGGTGDVVTVTFAATTANDLGVDAEDFSTAAGAQSALGVIDTAIENLSTARADIGAAQNRLSVTVTNLANAHENASAANSRIRDVDVARETASFTRNQIVSQAAVSVLAQANQLPSLAMSLLG